MTDNVEPISRCYLAGLVSALSWQAWSLFSFLLHQLMQTWIACLVQTELHRWYENCEMRTIVLSDDSSEGGLDPLWFPGGNQLEREGNSCKGACYALRAGASPSMPFARTGHVGSSELTVQCCLLLLYRP